MSSHWSADVIAATPDGPRRSWLGYLLTTCSVVRVAAISVSKRSFLLGEQASSHFLFASKSPLLPSPCASLLPNSAIPVHTNFLRSTNPIRIPILLAIVPRFLCLQPRLACLFYLLTLLTQPTLSARSVPAKSHHSTPPLH